MLAIKQEKDLLWDENEFKSSDELLQHKYENYSIEGEKTENYKINEDFGNFSYCSKENVVEGGIDIKHENILPTNFNRTTTEDYQDPINIKHEKITSVHCNTRIEDYDDSIDIKHEKIPSTHGNTTIEDDGGSIDIKHEKIPSAHSDITIEHYQVPINIKHEKIPFAHTDITIEDYQVPINIKHEKITSVHCNTTIEDYDDSIDLKHEKVPSTYSDITIEDYQVPINIKYEKITSAHCNTRINDYDDSIGLKHEKIPSTHSNTTIEDYGCSIDIKHEKMPCTHCDICDITIADTRLMKFHLKFHHPYSMSCSDCNENLSSPYDFFIHKRNAHKQWMNVQMKWFCEKCEKLTSSKLLAEEHLKRCTSHVTQCLYCDKVFPSREKALVHHKEHYDKARVDDKNCEKFKCEHCGNIHTGKRNYMTHLRGHRALETGEYRCTICGNKYTSNCFLKIHIQNHHKMEPIYKCNICSAKFHIKNSMQKHIRNHKRALNVTDNSTI